LIASSTAVATRVEVVAHSRLHFGLFSFGPPRANGLPQFGGVGAMIDEPRLKLSVEPWPEWVAVGEGSLRALEFAQRAAEGLGLPHDFRCRVEGDSAPAAHVGLGSGTQLALSAATAVCRLAGKVVSRIESLAPIMGRARRSSVGMHGFFRGGMIVDAGKRPQDHVSPLLARIELPANWRFVLLLSKEETGLFGAAEERAFAGLPAVSPAASRELRYLALEVLMATAASNRFAEFCDTLYQFGRQAGMCYAAYQGGPYATPRLERLVEAVRELGALGVTQSSWGPTLCVAMPSQEAAEAFVTAFGELPESLGMNMLITRPANQGATVRVFDGT
jgi:beta-ribofuranosylaminobenzene 5'-phosphate synthase